MPDIYNFSDLFISYSRKDMTFIEQLADRLRQDSYEIWLDKEDIPGAVEWWAEVEAGIESASAFVFVISPDSVWSDVCDKELQYAIKLNKRLVPVLHRDLVDPKDQQHLDDALKSHNWIFMRADDPFDSAYERLVTTLKTDLVHVQAHRRYLVKCREWEARDRDVSLLLFGSEVAEAETWLQTALSKQPLATDIQQEYILASITEYRRIQDEQIERQKREILLQERAANRLRYLIAGMAVFLAITFVMAGLVIRGQQQIIETANALEAQRLARFVDRGDFHMRENAYGEAVAEYTHAIEIVPGHVDVLYNRGLAYFYQQQYPEAVMDFDAVVKLEPQRDDVYYARGLVFMAQRSDDQTDMLERAIKDFRQAITLQPSNAEYYVSRGQAREVQLDYEAALEDYTSAIALDPQSAPYYSYRANIFASLERFDEAIMDYSSAIGINPKFSEAYIGRNYAYNVLAKYDEAEQDLKSFADFAPKFSFQKLPVALEDTQWSHYYGNTKFSHEYGLRWYRYSQGFHAGLDFGNSTEKVTVYAGVDGQVLSVNLNSRTCIPNYVVIKVDDYTIWYCHLVDVTSLSPGDTVTSETILGYTDVGGQNHLHLEVRYQNRWLMSPFLYLPLNVGLPFIDKFNDNRTSFYSSDTWNKWQTPVDQPPLILGGPLIGPLSQNNTEEEN